MWVLPVPSTQQPTLEAQLVPLSESLNPSQLKLQLMTSLKISQIQFGRAKKWRRTSRWSIAICGRRWTCLSSIWP